MEPMRLELVDADAIRRNDGLDPGGLTRLQLLRRAAATGSAVLGGGLLVTGVPAAHAQSATDVDILNVLLVNEAMEAAFYTEAAASGALSGRVLEFAIQVAANEGTHRDTVAAALGSAARAIPPFAFGNTTTDQAAFVATALTLESNDVAANNGAGPLLSKPVLALAGQIVSVEGRQAAWIRRIAYGPGYDSAEQYPAPSAFDAGVTPEQTRATVQSYGFVQGEV